jgi:hypothetical protein
MTTTLNLLSGNGQAAQINTAFPSPLRVSVTRDGVSVNGVQLRFTAPASGASAYYQSTGNRFFDAYTDVNGFCSSDTFIANGTLGGWTGSVASVATFEWYADFTAQNVDSPPAVNSLAIVGGADQQQAVNTAYAPLVVQIKDQYGAPMNHIAVLFSNSGYEAYGSFASGSAFTDANGRATSPIFTASATLGQFWVTASVGARNDQTQWTNIAPSIPITHTLIYCEA